MNALTIGTPIVEGDNLTATERRLANGAR